MGLITPGPVVITAAFIGYLVAGFPGAVIATAAIFTPIWLGVVLPGRWLIRHRHNPQVKAFVKGATAAAGGALSGAVVVLTRQAVTDIPAVVIALVTLGCCCGSRSASRGSSPLREPRACCCTGPDHRRTMTRRRTVIEMGYPGPAENRSDRLPPWLIRTFIDPGAEILYAPAGDVLAVAQREGARSFDAPGADYAHRGTQCTFEVLIDEYHLASDPALARLAAIVHAADIRADLGTDPLARGLLAIGEGGLDAEPDDQRLLERGSFVYDALYAWCRRQSEASHPAT